MNRFRLAFIERLSHFDWLRWMAGVNAKIMVVNEVKTKRYNELHAKDTQVID